MESALTKTQVDMCPVRGGESLQEQKATRGATEERAQISRKLNSGADGLEE